MAETVDQTVVETPTPEPKIEVISKQEFDHVMSDLHKQKAKARELEEKVRTIETQKLKEKEEWKTLADQYEGEAKQAKDEVAKIKEGLVVRTKFDAIKAEAIKLGIHESAIDDLRMLGWDDVRIETTSEGRVNVLGAEKAMQRVKTQKPYLFKAPGAPNVNVNTPGVVDGADISFSTIYEAEKEAKKSGNYGKYRELLTKFQAQKQ
jgi:hypothetical protein